MTAKKRTKPTTERKRGRPGREFLSTRDLRVLSNTVTEVADAFDALSRSVEAMKVKGINAPVVFTAQDGIDALNAWLEGGLKGLAELKELKDRFGFSDSGSGVTVLNRKQHESSENSR